MPGEEAEAGGRDRGRGKRQRPGEVAEAGGRVRRRGNRLRPW